MFLPDGEAGNVKILVWREAVKGACIFWILKIGKRSAKGRTVTCCTGVVG